MARSEITGGRTTVKSPASPPPATRQARRPEPVQKVSKDELRARIEKLERANAALRAKNKALKQDAAELAELLDTLRAELDRSAPGERRGLRPGRRRKTDPAQPSMSDHDPG